MNNKKMLISIIVICIIILGILLINYFNKQDKPDDINQITLIETANIDSDIEKEIITFSDGEINAYDDDNKLIWNINDEVYNGINPIFFINNFDNDDNDEILILFYNHIHLLDNNGKIIWRNQSIINGIIKAELIDLDLDGIHEIIFSTENTIEVRNIFGEYLWSGFGGEDTQFKNFIGDEKLETIPSFNSGVYDHEGNWILSSNSSLGNNIQNSNYCFYNDVDQDGIYEIQIFNGNKYIIYDNLKLSYTFKINSSIVINDYNVISNQLIDSCYLLYNTDTLSFMFGNNITNIYNSRNADEISRVELTEVHLHNKSTIFLLEIFGNFWYDIILIEYTDTFSILSNDSYNEEKYHIFPIMRIHDIDGDEDSEMVFIDYNKDIIVFKEIFGKNILTTSIPFNPIDYIGDFYVCGDRLEDIILLMIGYINGGNSLPTSDSGDDYVIITIMKPNENKYDISKYVNAYVMDFNIKDINNDYENEILFIINQREGPGRSRYIHTNIIVFNSHCEKISSIITDNDYINELYLRNVQLYYINKTNEWNLLLGGNKLYNIELSSLEGDYRVSDFND